MRTALPGFLLAATANTVVFGLDSGLYASGTHVLNERHGMKVRYYVDPDTGQPHVYNHDVREPEVEQVLGHPGEDRPGVEGSRVAIGQTAAGRYLRVIYVPDPEPDSVFVVTAYELTGKPLIAYRRRRRRGKR